MDLISGNWIGSYVYGDGYEEGLKGKSVSFTMALSYDGELIRGTCVDKETKALFGEPSTIEGTFEYEAVLFYKSYPKAKGLVGPSLLIAQQFNSSSIQYKGVLKKKFFSRKRYLEGIWEIHGSFLDEDGMANYYTLDGTWRAEKV